MNDSKQHQQRMGRNGEELAVAYLRKLGYKIIKRNYRMPQAEIDIIAKHKGVIVFVEVKARQTQTFGHPKWAVTPAKQRKISMAALAYLKQNHTLNTRARFDVVTIQSLVDNPQIEIIANAFELAYG